jgi:hypothetical protein
MTRIFIVSGLLAIGLSACASAAITPSPSPEPTEAASATPTSNLDGDTARQLMDQLIMRDEELARLALEQIQESGDERFVPVLLELLRGLQIGLPVNLSYVDTIEAMEVLSGQSFGGNWPDWIEWYGGTDILPPPGFTGWKGSLLSFIDSGFGVFLQDGFASTIRVEEIVWGGVTVDGIPALDHAEMIPAEEADYLELGEPVFGISLNGDSRAYPLRIMDWHEMANDTVGGIPLSLAYCTLCGAGIAFDGRASDGETYTFGSSGFLYRSNKLMYDRQTNTLWNQLTGEPVLGELVEKQVRLDLLPVVLTTWEEWLQRHPETQVLLLETGYERAYFPGAAYGDYFASDATMFPVWSRSDILETKDRIYALRVNGVPKAYPIDLLTEETVVNDVVADTALVLIAPGDQVIVDGSSLRTGAISYASGAEVRAYLRGGVEFAAGPEPAQLVDQHGGIWQVTEEALRGPDGEEALRFPGHLAYWFGWYAFFPHTLVYGES